MDQKWIRQSSKKSTEVDKLSTVIKNTTKDNRFFVVILKGVSRKVSKMVKRYSNLDTINFDHTVDNYAIKHALKRHKDDKIPLKSEDFNLIPDVIQNADNIKFSEKDDKVIIFSKEYDNRIIYLEEIRKKRRELAMKTMYWQDIPKKNKK